jgi:hypothetical protein
MPTNGGRRTIYGYMLMEDRECPNGWTGCEDCLRLKDCTAGLYHGEIAELEKQRAREAANSAREIIGMQEKEDFWGWWQKSSPPNLHSIPLPLDGPSAPGGGGKCRVPKKPQKKVPEYMKRLGM